MALYTHTHTHTHTNTCAHAHHAHMHPQTHTETEAPKLACPVCLRTEEENTHVQNYDCSDATAIIENGTWFKNMPRMN